jgi:uncharacterized protein (DUF58 family)
VKLTKRGKDYLKACLAATLIASVLDTKVVLALSMSLVIAALISAIILGRSNSEGLEIQSANEHISCYKGDEVRAVIYVKMQTRRFISIALSHIEPPKGIETNFERTSEDNFWISVRPRFAGRFLGFSATFELNDPLRLFAKKVEFVANDFVVDCYPSSILKEVSRSRPSPISLGELEGRTQGLGLEFYAIDRYTSSAERKNIFWRRVASLPDEKLLVKTRTTNIQKTIAISLILSSERKESLEWIDSVCEGVAMIGKTILDIGCRAKINYDTGIEIVSKDVTNLKELSEAIMDMSTAHVSDVENSASLLKSADIYVTGFNELQNSLLAPAVGRKPTLLIEDEGEIPTGISELAIVYKPFRDLSELVSRVTGQ